VLDLREGFDRHLEVLLSGCVSCVVDRLDGHGGAVGERSFVHGRVAVLAQEVFLGEVVRGGLELVQAHPGAPLYRAG
jgi:hypothetical protein